MELWDQQGGESKSLFIPTLCSGRDPEFVGLCIFDPEHLFVSNWHIIGLQLISAE